MQYFQQVIRRASGARAQVGAFRRPYPDDYRADQEYSLLSHRWEWTPDLHFILTGRQDGDVVEVTEDVIRDFLTAKAPADDIDSVLAAAPLPQTGRA
jgi:hypothetical protein